MISFLIDVFELILSLPERASFRWWKVLIGLLIVVLTIACIAVLAK